MKSARQQLFFLEVMDTTIQTQCSETVYLEYVLPLKFGTWVSSMNLPSIYQSHTLLRMLGAAFLLNTGHIQCPFHLFLKLEME